MEDIFRTVVTTALFFLILGTLVLVHEFGHFVTARLAGVRVLEFGIGFPPRAKVIRARGETLYTLNWLPIGGFVKLEGEDGDDNDDPRSFVRAKLPTKVVILLAGVFMNLITALAIFISILWLVGTPLLGLRFSEIQPGSPAAVAGLQPGETITAIDGVKFEFFGESQVLTELRSRPGETVTLTLLQPTGTTRDVTLTLRPSSQIDDKHGPLGITSSEEGPFEFPITYERNDLPTAIGLGASQTVTWFGLILRGLGDLVSSFYTNPTAPPPVAGPVGIARQIGDVFFAFGPVITLYVAGILSANLALVNVLPFPPLDGGRLFVILLKSIFGRRISLRAERLTYLAGFLFLFAFLIWVSGFDLIRALGGGT